MEPKWNVKDFIIVEEAEMQEGIHGTKVECKELSKINEWYRGRCVLMEPKWNVKAWITMYFCKKKVY